MNAVTDNNLRNTKQCISDYSYLLVLKKATKSVSRDTPPIVLYCLNNVAVRKVCRKPGSVLVVVQSGTTLPR